MNRNKALFSSTDWFSVSDARKKAMHDEIDALDPERLLNTSVETAVQHYIDKTAIEVPELDRANLVVDSREVSRLINDYGRQITVTTTAVDVTVPFEGAADAFGIRPSTYRMSAPHALVANGTLVFMVDANNRDHTQVRQEIEGTLDDIEHNLNNLRTNVEAFRKEVPRLAHEWIEGRRAKLLADRNLVAALGYKLKESTNSPPHLRAAGDSSQDFAKARSDRHRTIQSRTGTGHHRL